MTQHASSRSGARERKKSISTAAKRKSAKSIAAAELDALHDAGQDISAYVDRSRAKRPGRDVQRVNVDFPLDLLEAIDLEARRIGVTRQAFIKLRIADSLSGRR